MFIAEIVLLLLTGRLLGEAMQRIGQPAVAGQLIAGIVLGPSVLGLLWPDVQHVLLPGNPEQKAMIDAISHLGLLLLLLLAGMETDLRLVKRTGRAAASASLAGISLPFVCGFLLGQFLPENTLPSPDRRLITSLFLGTALAIASVKIVVTVVREMNFMCRNVGQVIIASSIIDDTVGWIIVSVTFSLARHGTVDATSIATTLAGIVAFLAASLTVGRRVVFSLIRWTNDTLVGEFAVISVILVLMGVMSLTTYAIGVHSLLGAFVAGVLVGESPILTGHIEERLRGLAAALFAPVFFGLAGLGTDLTVLQNSTLILLTVAMIAIASAGKFAGAFIGGRIGGMNFAESLALGCGMNARGSTEVIIASIGASMGVLSRDLFTVIVIMAVITTVAMPPTLRWALSRLPLGDEERARLDREEFEARGFVTNLERLLVSVDDSSNGKFAQRLAGLIAGLRGMPATVLHVARAAGKVAKEAAKEEARGGDQPIKRAAETAKESEPEGGIAGPIDVKTRVPDGPPEAAVAEEARKGYDLMVVGIGDVVTNERFNSEVSRLAAEFEGPLAIAIARGAHAEDPVRGTVSLLVPITGTEPSRRAAEVAVALSRSTRAQITALYVGGSVATGRNRRRHGRISTRSYEEAILKDVAEMAKRYQVPLQTAVRVDEAPDEAILLEAGRRRHNLIVMGVSRRPGDMLYFGNVAEAIIARSDKSILFVASGGVSTAPEGWARRQV